MMQVTSGFLPSYEEGAATAKMAYTAGCMQKKTWRGADISPREAGNAGRGVNQWNWKLLIVHSCQEMLARALALGLTRKLWMDFASVLDDPLGYLSQILMVFSVRDLF